MKFCKAGHAMNAKTTRVDNRGARPRDVCRTCEALRTLRLKLARRLGYSSLAELRRLAVCG